MYEFWIIWGTIIGCVAVYYYGKLIGTREQIALCEKQHGL